MKDWQTFAVVLCIVGVVRPAPGLEYDCSPPNLENCTQQLLKYSREDVPVPENEEQVLQNCG